MITRTELHARLAAWRAAVTWQLIDRDRAYGAQCWDLSADWADTTTGLDPRDFWTLYAPGTPDHTLASSIWLYWPLGPRIAELFTRQGRDEPILAGDILIWARSRNYPASHTAVALEDTPADAGSVYCLTQNPGAARPEHLTTAGLLGTLRPITTPDPAPLPEEEHEMSTVYIRPTANSSPLTPGDETSSRVWAGDDRVYFGTKYSGVWALDTATGETRRLTMAEWGVVEAAYQASGRPIPLAQPHGNAVEILLHAPKKRPL